MAAVTTRTKFLLVFFCCIFTSCSNTTTVKESDLINGSTISQFIRQQQYSGYINTYYDDGITIKSIRKYSNGKKNGEHQGWWPNGNKKYLYYNENIYRIKISYQNFFFGQNISKSNVENQNVRILFESLLTVFKYRDGI